MACGIKYFDVKWIYIPAVATFCAALKKFFNLLKILLFTFYKKPKTIVTCKILVNIK